MKILKRPDNLVFDTESNIIEQIPNSNGLVPISKLIPVNIVDFLNTHFPKGHSIFECFEKSFFYVYEE